MTFRRGLHLSFAGRAGSFGHLGRLLLGALLGVWFTLAAEFWVVMALGRAELASVWELQFGTLWLLPGALVFGAVAALPGALFGRLLLAVSASPKYRALLAILLAALATGVGWGIAAGRHFAAPGARVAFSLSVAAGAGALVWLLGPTISRWLLTHPKRGALVTALVLLGLELANRLTFVGLYPAWHHGLALATLLLAPLLTLVHWKDGGGDRAKLGLTLPLLVLLVVLLGLAAPASARRLAGYDNFRLLLVDHAPLLGQVVHVMSKLSPEAEWAPKSEPACVPATPSGPCADPSATTARASTFSLSGQDILLITVDALRADHLGVYGYARPTSPNLDELAKAGQLFEYAYSATPHTSYSITSLMTGKYMRPLLLQGVGADSETWAQILRLYGYRTAGFYPPAVFFIDPERFKPFSENQLGFEYVKREFAEGELRLEQVRRYLDSASADQRVFIWVHWFAPHEPYEKHDGHYFGEKDVDRYDSEIAATDASIGKLVRVMRAARPRTAVLVTSDHGEEFGEHGGRYHGTSVYEEQVRVPLIVSVPGNEPGRVSEPVQTIDLLPTVLGALQIPRAPRVRGRDLGPLLSPGAGAGAGLALAETDEQTLLAEGSERLICARKIGACTLYDLATDPKQQGRGQSPSERLASLRQRLKELASSHGRYEMSGLRSEGRGWPTPILRAMAGDGDAALEVAELLDDADVAVRRKAAELLFKLRREETAGALQLALRRAQDRETERWCALGLTRLGHGASLVFELARSPEQTFRRWASLALAETGDAMGEATLIEWWQEQAKNGYDYATAKELLHALAKIRSKDAVWTLLSGLDDVRLRPLVAGALAAIGDEAAVGPIVLALKKEHSQEIRAALADAAVSLDAGSLLAEPLVRWLGVADPLPNGLDYALRARTLQHVGGPDRKALERLYAQSSVGVGLTVVVPRGGNGRGVRVLVRARVSGDSEGSVHLGVRRNPVTWTVEGQPRPSGKLPELDPERSVRLVVPPGKGWVEVFTTVPALLDARPGRAVHFVVYAERNVEIAALAFVPLADELLPLRKTPTGKDLNAAADLP